MRKFLIGFAVAAALIAFVVGLVAIGRYAHNRHVEARQRYEHNLRSACAAHRNVLTLVAPGTTGAYVVCRDGYVTKVER